jgi:gliding motility-associated-like protein
MRYFKSKIVKSTLQKMIKEKILRLALFAGLVLLSIMDLEATHIVGGDLTYRKVGPNRFEITLELRRDCLLGSPEALFDDPASIGIYSSNGALQINLGINGQLLIPYDASDTLNNVIVSDCGFEGEQVCVEEFKYVQEVTLPFKPGGYFLAYQRCCRNASLNNVENPLETGATYFVRIPEAALLEDNDSPVFNQWPPVYICVNESINFDQGATDVDGDSLVYRLCDPRTGATLLFNKPQPPAPPPYDPIIWAQPYSLDDLMGGVPLEIDSQTGILTGTPNTVGQFLVGVCVDEYRNGEYLGSVNRDFQYNVRFCSDPPNAMFEAPEKTCNGLTVEFTNTSTAGSEYFWAFTYPDTINNTSTEENPTFTFPSSGEYDVFLRVVRGTDQCDDEIIKTISVFDADFVVDFDIELDECTQDSTVKYVLTDNSSIDVPGVTLDQFNWTITQGGTQVFVSGNPGIVELDTGDFNVVLSVLASNGCEDSTSMDFDFDDFVLKPDFTVAIDGCSTDEMISIALNSSAETDNPDYNILETNWTVTYVGSGSPQMITGNGAVVDIPRVDFTVLLEVVADNGCSALIEKEFDITDFIPTVDFGYSLLECNMLNNPIIQFVELFNDSIQHNNPAIFMWTFNNSPLVTGDTVLYESIDEDSIVATLSIEFEVGCFTSITKVIYLDDIRPQVNYDWVAEECPTDDTITISLFFNDSQVYGLTYDSIVWEVGIASNLMMKSGDTISINIPKDSSVIVTLSTNFENGCSDTDNSSFYPGDFAQINFVSDSLVLCPFEEAILLEDANSDFIYTWNPTIGLDLSEPSNPIVSTGMDITYYVTVSDGLCSVEDSIHVDILEQIQLEIDGLDYTCDGTVELTVTGAVGPGIYEWSTDPGFSFIIETGPDLSTTFSGDSETYYVRFLGEVCDAIGTSITLTNESLSIDFISPYEACNLDTFQYPVINNVPAHTVSINWDDDLHVIDGQNTFNPTIIILAEDVDSFYLYFTATNQFDCILRDSVLILLDENPEVDFTIDVVNCENYEVCVEVVGDFNGFATWDMGDTTTTDDELVGTRVCYTYPEPGEYNIQLGNISINCPFADVTKTVILKDSLDIFGNSDSIEVCINSNLDIPIPVFSNGFSYKWCDSSGNTISMDSVLSVLIIDEVFYVLKVEDELGCEFADTIYITPFDFDYELVLPPVFCAGEPIEAGINVSGDIDYIYEWLPLDCVESGGDTSNPILNVTELKTIFVQVTHPALGCVLRDSFDVIPTELMVEAGAAPDTEIYLGESVDIFVVDTIAGDTYEWNNGATTSNQTVTPEETTTYTVTVTDVDGCTGIASITITVIQPECEEDVFLPNAFTPNGDDVNSVLFVRSNFVDEMLLIIYNRWNEEVFRSTSQNVGWDGTYKGVDLAPDSYAYYLTVTCVDGFTIERSGNINLIR